MDVCPALLAIVLETHDVGTEERREFALTTTALTLVTHLVVQYVGFHLHLKRSAQYNTYGSMNISVVYGVANNDYKTVTNFAKQFFITMHFIKRLAFPISEESLVRRISW